MNKLCVAALLALSLTGCAQQTFVMKQNQVSAATKTTSQPFFVSGIGQRKSIDAAQVCGGPEKVSRVEVQQTFVNGLLSVVTFGIYTPREARVYCAI